ncbi:hypothetical protein cyc_08302 [Cyclospora cayetanensis]|uniref:Uncharacterized protein n=1 Tax=Cyclospora cayetanensis TaxID=88456 RepID=A0A1D3D6E8_9EIME|nr:hypothetical protein cyc_08302 [Cyclospora cayetanensis]
MRGSQQGENAEQQHVADAEGGIFPSDPAAPAAPPATCLSSGLEESFSKKTPPGIGAPPATAPPSAAWRAAAQTATDGGSTAAAVAHGEAALQTGQTASAAASAAAVETPQSPQSPCSKKAKLKAKRRHFTAPPQVNLRESDAAVAEADAAPSGALVMAGGGSSKKLLLPQLGPLRAAAEALTAFDFSSFAAVAQQRGNSDAEMRPANSQGATGDTGAATNREVWIRLLCRCPVVPLQLSFSHSARRADAACPSLRQQQPFDASRGDDTCAAASPSAATGASDDEQAVHDIASKRSRSCTVDRRRHPSNNCAISNKSNYGISSNNDNYGISSNKNNCGISNNENNCGISNNENNCGIRNNENNCGISNNESNCGISNNENNGISNNENNLPHHSPAYRSSRSSLADQSVAVIANKNAVAAAAAAAENERGSRAHWCECFVSIHCSSSSEAFPTSSAAAEAAPAPPFTAALDSKSMQEREEGGGDALGKAEAEDGGGLMTATGKSATAAIARAAALAAYCSNSNRCRFTLQVLQIPETVSLENSVDELMAKQNFLMELKKRVQKNPQMRDTL